MLSLLLLFGCKKEYLHCDDIIRKHRLTYFSDWDSEGTPFKKNASLYVNKATDSCLLILKNEKGDTLLCHEDNSIINAVLLRYKVDHNNWIVIRSDYGRTAYGDSLGGIEYDQHGYSPERYSLDGYYKINRETKKLEKINLVGEREFLERFGKKYKYLSDAKIAGLENGDTYVFKDTLDGKQVLYQMETKYKLVYDDGGYVVEPTFGRPNKIAIYTNGMRMERVSDTYYMGEKLFYGKEKWEFKNRYEVVAKRYYKFKGHKKKMRSLAGDVVYKTEMVVNDLKNKTSRIIATFGKDKLLDDLPMVIAKQRGGKIYVGVDTQMDHEVAYYFELDTVSWRLKELKN